MTLEQETLRAVSRRLIPFLFILYVVSFLDRVNVGLAALEMNRRLNLSPAVYGFGAGIFFIGYSLFEVASNLILARVGAPASCCSRSCRSPASRSPCGCDTLRF